MSKLVYLIVMLLQAAGPLWAGPEGPAREAPALRVGLYQNPPKIFIDEAGRPAGIFVDLLEGVAEQEGWRLDYVPGEWNGLLELLEAGRLDLMPDVAITPERSARFSFHQVPAVESWSQIYAHPRAGIRGLPDLKGRRVARLKGASQNDLFDAMMKGFGYAVEAVEAPTFEEAFAAVAQRRADAVISNHFFGDRAFRRHGLERTPIVFAPAALHFAAPRSGPAERLRALDRRLQAWKRDPDSPYYAALRRWMDPAPQRHLPGWVLSVLAAVAACLVLAAAVILVQRRQALLKDLRLAQTDERLRRTRAEAELSRSVLASQQQASQDGILVAAASGGIVSWNRRFIELWGLTEGSLASRSAWEALDAAAERAQDPAGLRERLQAAQASPGARAQAEVLLKDGRMLECLGTPLPEPPGGRVWSFRDCTALKREAARRQALEEQLRQAQKMEAIGRLAGGVAHDFNNLLAVILGYAASARGHAGADERLKSDMEQVEGAARRAAELTKQLLAFSRKQPLQPVVLDLGEVLGSMEKFLARLLGAGIALDIRRGPGRVLADRVQLEQVVMNLAANARDAMPDGGRLVLECGEVDLDEAAAAALSGARPGPYVRLRVSDSGAGMDAETRQRVFEPFFTTKAEGHGTGLGLATVYGIVKQSGGHLEVQSELGRGSTFDLYLPRAAGQPQSAPAEPLKASRTEGRSVLVVEDEATLRSLFGRMLSELGCQVSLAADGAEALHLVEAEGLRPELLLCDLSLPGLSGRQVAMRLKERLPGLSVALMSGYSEQSDGQDGGLEPGVRFLQKPFGVRELVRLLQATP